MKQNLIDRAVAAVSPEKGMKRMAARKSMELLNSGYGNYGASADKKSMRGWRYAGGSAKEDIEDNIDVLRQRSRDAYMGIPTATAALKAKRTNVIAGGLTPAPQIDSDFLGLDSDQTARLQAQISREFALWAESNLCDAERMDSFYELQQLAFLSYLMNGDALALLGMEQMPGQPYDLRIRLIEADRICSPDLYDRLSPCEVNGHRVYRIVQGVETNENGAVVAYWISSRHPLASDRNLQPEGMHWDRVEAYGEKTGRRNALFIMARERAGQVRGVPVLAPVLEELKQLGRYTEAEVTAAVLQSYFTLFVYQDSATNDLPLGEAIPPEQQVDTADQGTYELAPGAIIDLAPGEKIEPAAAQHPNTTYPSFIDAMTKQIGAALEVPQEVLTKKFEASYSAARGALNEFWRTCDMERDWFAEDFCQPIYETWFAEAVAKGRIQAPGFWSDPAIRKAYTACKWSGPARTNLSPKDEIQAAVMRVNAGFSTAAEEAAQMTGADYTQVIQQRLIEAEMKRKVDEISGWQDANTVIENQDRGK